MVLALAAGLVVGQTTDGIVVGRVLDGSGGGVPGAAVRLHKPETGVGYTAEAGEEGFYRFQNIPAGTYELAAKAGGFAEERLRDVSVQLNQTTTVNVRLRIDSLATQVNVTDASALIDTTTAQIGSTSARRQIADLPASSGPMGVLNLSLLAAGVASSGGLGVGDGPSVGGQRPRSNGFTLEGVDNNRKDVTGRNVAVSNEATAEVTVLQNQFSAEFGHSSGAQFNVILKSGTNALHGSAYEYLQNRKWNAIDEALARQGIRSNPRYDSSLLGGSAGGPVLPNKLFYFADFEYNPIGRASTLAAGTKAPTSDAYQRLATIPGVSSTNLDALRTWLGVAPAATGSVNVGGIQAAVGVIPRVTPSYLNTYNWLTSVDWSISPRDQARGRYVANRSSGLDPDTAAGLPTFNFGRKTTSWLLSVSEFHSFSSRWTNELRLAYNRYDDRIPSGDLRFPGLDTFPTITIEQDLSVQLGPFSQSPQATDTNTYQVANNVNYAAGRHTLTFGADVRRHIATMNFTSKARGEYTYSTLERYLFDLNPDVVADRNTGGRPFSGNQTSVYGFINDQFRLRPNLTVTAGLRYEHPGIAEGLKDQTLNAASGVPGLIEFDVPETPRKNFAPRVGLAWSPGQSARTSVRAGLGLAYDSYFDNLGANTRPPQTQTTASRDIRQTVPGFLAGGGIPANAASSTLSIAEARARTAYFVPDQLSPYGIQWNVGVQRVFRKDYTVQARYLGVRGVHLINQTRINVQSPVSASMYLPTLLARPSQAELDAMKVSLEMVQRLSYRLPAFEAAGFTSPITSYVPRGNSIYHGLAFESERRFATGFLFKAAYTWSHAIDDSTADVASTVLSPRRPQDFNDMRAERATSMLDRRHRFTLTGIWDVPLAARSANRFARGVLGGWTVAATYIAESPAYATVQSGVDSNLNGDSVGDRAIVNPAGEAGRSTDVTALKNSAGATVAYLAIDPTARYIRARAGALANAGRNTLPLAGINNLDASIIKRIPAGEGRSVEFRGMLYNAANHPQFTPGSINSIRAVPRPATRNNLIPGNPAFNSPSSVYESNARTVMLALRFVF